LIFFVNIQPLAVQYANNGKDILPIIRKKIILGKKIIPIWSRVIDIIAIIFKNVVLLLITLLLFILLYLKINIKGHNRYYPIIALYHC